MTCQGSSYVHLFAGGFAGTIAAVATCPLEVVKTRLQSSAAVFQPMPYREIIVATKGNAMGSTIPPQVNRPNSILGCIRHIVKTEGASSLYKGLGPNIIGVAPARAVYFAIYAKITSVVVKKGLDQNSVLVPICAGACAGFTVHTMTSPVWFVKTKLQLNSTDPKFNMKKCIRKTYAQEGFKGFYRGLSASYWGVTETIIHFTIYEYVKRAFREFHKRAAPIRTIEAKEMNSGTNPSANDVGEKNRSTDFMISAGISRTIASICAYPHEVARTRMRQEEYGAPRKYRSFWQTLILVYKEEGRKGLYGGLGTQLFRQVPNSAIMFMIYEMIVSVICSHELD